MPRSVWFAILLVLATACGPPRPAATVTPGPAVSGAATPAPGSTPTQLRVHVVTKSTGGQYATMVQETRDPGATNDRPLYEVRYLSAEGERTNPTNAVMTVDQPHITFHDRTGQRLIADAPKAKMTAQDKSVFMSGGVHARAQDGSVLTCDRLRYDGRTEKLQGDGHVTLTSPSGPDNYRMTGEHLYGDVRLDHVRITNAP